MSVKQHEPMCFDSAQDRWWWNDHFLGDQIHDEWTSTIVGAGTTVVVDQQTGGIVRLTTGAVATDRNELWWNNRRIFLVTKRVSMETRVKLNHITNFSNYYALFFDWSNYIAFNPTSGQANFRIICRDGGVSTNNDTGIPLDTNYHIFRIECHTHGSNHVHFYIDGTETANSPITTNIPDDVTDYFQPYLRAYTSDNVSKSIDVDYVAVRQDR